MSNLTKCPECGHPISQSAKTCPNCGAKLKGTSMTEWFALLGFIAVMLFLLGYCAQ